jgi:hypothetical protein
MEWPWGPSGFLYSGYQVFLSVVKQLRRGVNHPPQFSAEVKEMLELNLYKPSGDFMACSRANFTFCLIEVRVKFVPRLLYMQRNSHAMEWNTRLVGD